MDITNAIRAERFKIWLKALRSGNFKQTRCLYHGRNGGHCCLGVGQIALGLPKEESDVRLTKYTGMTFNDTQYLIKLNDDGHRNFAYIADRIESKILSRFLTK